MALMNEYFRVEAGGQAQGNLVRARLALVAFTPDPTTPYPGATTATIKIVPNNAEMPEVTVLTAVPVTAAAVWRPMAVVHNVSGAEIADAYAMHTLSECRIQVAVTGAGGTFGLFTAVFHAI